MRMSCNRWLRPSAASTTTTAVAGEDAAAAAVAAVDDGRCCLCGPHAGTCNCDTLFCNSIKIPKKNVNSSWH